MNLALIKKTPELKAQAGLYHFGFEVDDVEPLKGVFEQAGASSEVQPRPKNRDAEFRVHDPDGNPIDLVHSTLRSMGRVPCPARNRCSGKRDYLSR